LKKLEKEEMLNIVGGGTLSASLITSIVRGVNALFEIGQSIGTSIRRIYSGKICGFN
jgi:hypothetical protein